MAFIGLISDTHGYFDDRLKDFLRPVDVIWHAGDFGGYGLPAKIASFKPLIGVYGNCDGQDVRIDYPRVQLIEMQGMKILMTHIGGYPGRYDPYIHNLIEAHRPNIFVCGHSHILKVVNDRHYNMLVLNPGAAGLQGFHLVRTALRFKIENSTIKDMEVGEWPRD